MRTYHVELGIMLPVLVLVLMIQPCQTHRIANILERTKSPQCECTCR